MKFGLNAIALLKELVNLYKNNEVRSNSEANDLEKKFSYVKLHVYD